MAQTRDTNLPNWFGTWTLYRREVQRFLKIHTQTVLGPIVSTHLFLAVFTLALGRSDGVVGGAMSLFVPLDVHRWRFSRGRSSRSSALPSSFASSRN